MSNLILIPQPFNFITDRLAIGSVEARSTPGFVAVVSVLGNMDRPGDEWHGAPDVPEGVPVWKIDLQDGEMGLELELTTVCNYIAAKIISGCVLVHCGAGYSRSVAVVVAYLCRYMGMRLDEAVDFIKARRPGACPAPIFWEAITKWLKLDELAAKGPRP